MYRSVDGRGNPDVASPARTGAVQRLAGHGPRSLIVYGPAPRARATSAPVADVQPGYPLVAGTPIFRVQLRGDVRRHDGGPRLRDHLHDRLQGPGHHRRMHTYVNRLSEGTPCSTARGRRCKLPTPHWITMARWLSGYSQGGATAVGGRKLNHELRPGRTSSVFAGAPPADLVDPVPVRRRRQLLVGAIGYALNSIMAAYPEYADEVRALLTPVARNGEQDTPTQCVPDDLQLRFPAIQPGLPPRHRPTSSTPSRSRNVRRQRIGVCARTLSC